MTTPRDLETGAWACTPSERDRADFIADVEYYFRQTPRQLPSRYLYDALGSALFDAICGLPWYGVTRAEARLLSAHRAEILARAGAISQVIELGAGNGEKLRALLAGRADLAPSTVHLVDVSDAALTASSRALAELPGVTVLKHQATYEDGLDELASAPREPGRTLAVFLGSNIGNFDPPACEAFLRLVRGALAPGDALLLGADLVKPEAQLRLAYDDPLGVTAAFNRNILVRMNRELGANFDVSAFAHHTIWNAEASRVEMHLVSLRPQHVQIAAAGLDADLGEGEMIWTESSYKYEPAALTSDVERCGFHSLQQWIDGDYQFALTLFEAV
jgi:L-histidine N-alpha-methyltransferase